MAAKKEYFSILTSSNAIKWKRCLISYKNETPFYS